MHKLIKQNETLTITGQNIYPGVDTAVYWNSVSEENKAEIIPNSFNSQNTQVQVSIPCCLPEHNKVVLYNGINYTTGTQAYQFVGYPEIDELSPYSQLWQGDVIVKGKYLEEITGVFAGGVRILDYDWPSSKKTVFRVPNDFVSGHVEIRTEVGNVKSTGALLGVEPPLYATLELGNTQPRYYGDKALVRGKSLHKINRINLSGINEEILIPEDSFTHLGSTGISFLIPQGVLNGSPITIQNQEGFYQSGDFVTTVHEEFRLSETLNINSSYIKNLDKSSEIYNLPVVVSGINLDKSKILFKGYDDSYIEASVVSSGLNYKKVNVPKNIKGHGVLASGYVNGYTGIGLSEELFYPLPTIQSISSTSWTMGTSIEINAINASEIYPTVGITGKNLITETYGNDFVSNPSYWTESQNYFGYVLLDNSSLEQNIETGHTKIVAEVNSVFAGEGHPFLVSTHQANEAQNSQELTSALGNSTFYENFDNLTGQKVTVSGKKPRVMGLSNNTPEASGLLVATGSYFFSATGLKLSNNTETKVISKSQFKNGISISPLLSSPFPTAFQLALYDIYSSSTSISVIPTGDGVSSYEQVHAIVFKIEDFNFTSKSGELNVVTPYHV